MSSGETGVRGPYDQIGIPEIPWLDGAVEGDPVVELNHPPELADHGGERTVVDERAHAGIAHHEGELVRGQAGAERHDDDAALAGGEEVVQELDPVVSEEADALAFGQAEPIPPGDGASSRAGVELAVGEPFAGRDEDQRDLLRRQPRALAEDVTVQHGPLLLDQGTGDRAPGPEKAWSVVGGRRSVACGGSIAWRSRL